MAGRKLFGKVIKKSSNKTISVEVERMFSHKLYKKTLKRSSRYLVHDPENQACLGDDVFIIETRPVSKMKKWVLFNAN